MPVRPSRLWKELPPDLRTAAADALWRDDQGFEQQAEATALLAQRLKFRTKSVFALPIEKRAKYLAQVADVSDSLAGRALVAYHFAAARPLMAAFLDALGIAHENGLIADEDVPAPDRARLEAAVAAVRQAFPADAVDLYLSTLVALDGDTWAALEPMLPARA